MRASVLLLGLLVACRAPATPVVSPAPAVFTVAYHDAASVFEVMDNVTAWYPGKNDEEYRAYWKERFGISPEDEAAFQSYGEIRKRYYPQSPPPVGMFPPRRPRDPIANAFYESETIEDALARLTIAPADVSSLRAFYQAFSARLDLLRAESRAFPAIAAAMTIALNTPKTYAFARRLVQAYNEPEIPHFSLLYVWWPPVEDVGASPRGDVLLMKYNPLKHADGAKRDIDVPIHEFIHVVSSRRSDDEKRALSKTFQEGCVVGPGVKPVMVLEESLTVAEQKLYLREVDPARLDFSKSWYGDPWVSTYSKLLFDLVDTHPAIDDTFMRAAARQCAGLVSASGSAHQ